MLSAKSHEAYPEVSPICGFIKQSAAIYALERYEEFSSATASSACYRHKPDNATTTDCRAPLEPAWARGNPILVTLRSSYVLAKPPNLANNINSAKCRATATALNDRSYTVFRFPDSKGIHSSPYWYLAI